MPSVDQKIDKLATTGSAEESGYTRQNYLTPKFDAENSDTGRLEKLPHHFEQQIENTKNLHQDLQRNPNFGETNALAKLEMELCMIKTMMDFETKKNREVQDEMRRESALKEQIQALIAIRLEIERNSSTLAQMAQELNRNRAIEENLMRVSDSAQREAVTRFQVEMGRAFEAQSECEKLRLAQKAKDEVYELEIKKHLAKLKRHRILKFSFYVLLITVFIQWIILSAKH